MNTLGTEPVLDRLRELRFLNVGCEVVGEVLVLTLPAKEHARLLSNVDLRETIVQTAEQIGFTRVVLELENT